jgi:hypothetical protein
MELSGGDFLPLIQALAAGLGVLEVVRRSIAYVFDVHWLGSFWLLTLALIAVCLLACT